MEGHTAKRGKRFFSAKVEQGTQFKLKKGAFHGVAACCLEHTGIKRKSMSRCCLLPHSTVQRSSVVLVRVWAQPESELLRFVLGLRQHGRRQ